MVDADTGEAIPLLDGRAETGVTGTDTESEVTWPIAAGVARRSIVQPRGDAQSDHLPVRTVRVAVMIAPAGRCSCSSHWPRSLSCYLGQSVLFVALLPAWTLGLGARLTVAQAALLAVGVWLALLLAPLASARAGYRGLAETPAAPPHLRPGGADPVNPTPLSVVRRRYYRASGTRTSPSCTAVTTIRPSRVKNLPVARPRAPDALGERHS